MVANNTVNLVDILGLIVYVSGNKGTTELSLKGYKMKIAKPRVTSEDDDTCNPPECKRYKVYCEAKVSIVGTTKIVKMPKLVTPLKNMTKAEIAAWNDFINRVKKHEDGHMAINNATLKATTTATGYTEDCDEQSAKDDCRSQLDIQAQNWYDTERAMNKLAHQLYHARVGTTTVLPPGFALK